MSRRWGEVILTKLSVSRTVFIRPSFLSASAATSTQFAGPLISSTSDWRRKMTDAAKRKEEGREGEQALGAAGREVEMVDLQDSWSISPQTETSPFRGRAETNCMYAGFGTRRRWGQGMHCVNTGDVAGTRWRGRVEPSERPTNRDTS